MEEDHFERTNGYQEELLAVHINQSEGSICFTHMRSYISGKRAPVSR